MGHSRRTTGFWHPALFYRGEAQFLDGCLPFVRDGVLAGDPVAVAVPGARLALLQKALRAEIGRDADRVRFLDMGRAGRNPAWIIPGVLRDFADRHPHERVRIIGEPIWHGRSELEYPACAQHEALINMAFTGRDVAILCPYDADGLDGRALADAARTHPVLLDHDAEWDSDDYAPEAVVDGYNRPLPPAPADAPNLPFDWDAFERCRAFALDRAAAAGLSDERGRDAELAVSELVANSIVHGGGTGVLAAWREQDLAVFEVRDSGHIADPLAGRRPADPLTPGGRGILLVNRMADLVRVHTTAAGTTVRIFFAR
ncbi:anti-sigma factor RsbA family regulatory protein [Actinomadura rayongensis]|uniref:Sensor histidine kinase n=1 Tax=Actinomadura rayongensis TaxID=1429076 RepID=A0A6I4WDK6_9ACTN|nr:sensor histidine kinase [Actinomadura rayongensis]